VRGLRSIAAGAALALLAATLVTSPGGAAELSVTASPATDLVDGQVVHVTVTGASPQDFGYARLCAAGGDTSRCYFGGGGGAGTVDEQGSMEFDLVVDAEFTLFDGAVVDCRVAPGCALVTVLSNNDGSTSQSVQTPLAFRPDGPLLPPPTITVSPSADLLDGTTVHVTGTGFAPGSGVQLTTCKSPFTKYDDCDSPQTYVQTAADGSLTADVFLSARFTTFTEQVDCRVDACELVATRDLYQFEERHAAHAVLAFRPDGPLRPPPTISVEPTDGLVDGQEIQISGTGFRPGFIQIAECGGTSANVYERCTSSGDSVVADATGAISGTVKVTVLARLSAGFVDCRQPPGCTIAALDFNDITALAETPVTFDPAGPAPTFPTLTVAPAGPLAARSGAIVSGTGLPPNSSIYLQVCSIENGLPQECSGSGSDFVQTDGDGAFVAGTVVTAVIAGHDGSEIDCRQVACAILADTYNGYPGIGLLDFGPPPATAGQRYLAPVFDDVDLTEGIVYRSTTNSRGEPVDLKLDVYRPAGDTETKRPAVMWMFGGYFGSGDRVQLREMAQAMARRGYVSVSIDYRTRPEIFSSEHGCVNVGGTCLDPTQLAPAITDARDDARAAMVWLHEHAAEYGIEPRAISSAGWSAGAITSLGLAHDSSGERAADSIPAAAISLAGILTGIPQAADPPTLMMGGNHDTLLPLGSQIAGCGTIVTAGASCEFVAYSGLRPAPAADDCVKWSVTECSYVLGRNAEHGWFFSDRPDVIEHISTFLAEKVLKPVGILAPPPEPDHHHHHPRPHHHHHHDRDHGHDHDH
jgi:dienelactone hydrolase